MTTFSTHSPVRSDRSFPILIIEDDLEHQLMIKHGLEQRFPQASPMFVQTAEEALIYLQASLEKEVVMVRLILLDIFLPQPEIGWQLLTTIRQTHPNLPVIAISSHHTQENVQEAYRLGVHSFIAKPLTLEQWTNYFEVIYLYWVKTVTLPAANQY